MRYASPEARKQFSMEMFTRDPSLEDLYMSELIDNNLDAYLLKHQVPISELIFRTPAGCTSINALMVLLRHPALQVFA